MSQRMSNLEPRKRKGHPAERHSHIQAEIARRIRTGIYSQQMPSVSQLAEEFKANPLTIRKSLNSLEAVGMIEKRERVGSFVKKKQRVALLYISSVAGDNNLFRSPVYVPLSDAVESELEKCGYSLTTRLCSTSSTEFATALKNEVDGCVVILSNESAAYLRHLKDLPLVRVMSIPGGEAGSAHISYDNSLIGPLAADYLLKKGCRVFVYYGHATGVMFSDRLDAFKRRLESSGGELVHIQADTAMRERELFMAARDGIHGLLKKQPKKPTGIYISADLFAVPVYQALYSLGLTPVHDIPVISTDNNPLYLYGLYPRPPTIDIRMAEIGRRATQMLMDIIGGRLRAVESDEMIIFPPVIRSEDDAAAQ